MILTIHKIGKKWSELANIIKGRTENNIKNRCNSMLKKQKNKLFEKKFKNKEN